MVKPQADSPEGTAHSRMPKCHSRQALQPKLYDSDSVVSSPGEV